MPQRGNLMGNMSPFGTPLFASNWMAGRERASTLQSIRSSDAPSSTGDSPADNDVRTLDYLGLVDTPQSDKVMNQQRPVHQTIADLAAMNAYNNKNTANRFRSFSVNAKEKYADGEEDDMDQYEQLQQMYASGQITPSESAAAQAAAIHEAVRQHNLEVQAFANFASANRPRARTAGVLDSPSSRTLRNYIPTPSRLDNSITASELQSTDWADDPGLITAMQNAQIEPNPYPKPAVDTSSLEQPTRSLWLGNIPSSTTVSSLNVIFGQFGPIEFARVLTHKSCGFVNFENVQSAMSAKAQCNGREIFPGSGPVRIGYAKEQSAANTPGANGAYPSPSPDPFVSKNRDGGVGGSHSNNVNAETAAAAMATPNLLELRDEIYSIVQQFGATSEDQTRMSASLDSAMAYDDYLSEIPPIPEPSHNRVHDAPRLREIRKRVDSNSISQVEIENVAMEMLPEIAELSSDYLGNTVVQKLFERCSEDTKEAMLVEIAPHLAEIGVHKNGTWAAQKIIDVARTPRQMTMIVDALRPHAVSLFLDQYGNYVMQCCLRFQSPLNDFIFETMLKRLWDVAQGRFGARAMRACLESHGATHDQRRLMAAAIALHSVQLATNSNGALLLTWFLDTCTFPKRRSVLAPRLIPHLVHLCTHKVAYLTVLKIINQRNEPDARDSILRALFFDDATLTSILNDQQSGATLIFKVLTTPFLDEKIRPECIENVRNVLVRIKASGQGYKRLMDEVGLSTRHGTTPVNDSRSASKTRGVNGHPPHLDTNPHNGYARQPSYNTPQHQQQMEHPGLNRTVSMDSSNASGGYDPYSASNPNGLVTPQYTHSPALSNAGMNMSPVNPQQQLQYQQAMLQAQQSQMQHQRPPPGFYPTPPMNANGMGYSNGSPVDPYRGGSPLVAPGMPPGMGYQQQQYNPMMGGYGGYPGMGMQAPLPQYYGQQQGMQAQGGAQQGGGRRGRVSRSQGRR